MGFPQQFTSWAYWLMSMERPAMRCPMDSITTSGFLSIALVMAGNSCSFNSA